MLFSAAVTLAFQLSLAILVLYRTYFVFRIRSRCDPRSDGKSDPPYSGYSPFTLVYFRYGAFTLWSAAFQQTSRIHSAKTRVQTPHPPVLAAGVRFVLFPVHSPLLRKSLLLSLPARNKMFQFWAFAFRTRPSPCPELMGCPIR